MKTHTINGREWVEITEEEYLERNNKEEERSYIYFCDSKEKRIDLKPKKEIKVCSKCGQELGE